jgi:hypothetical protein
LNAPFLDAVATLFFASAEVFCGCSTTSPRLAAFFAAFAAFLAAFLSSLSSSKSSVSTIPSFTAALF